MHQVERKELSPALARREALGEVVSKLCHEGQVGVAHRKEGKAFHT